MGDCEFLETLQYCVAANCNVRTGELGSEIETLDS